MNRWCLVSGGKVIAHLPRAFDLTASHGEMRAGCRAVGVELAPYELKANQDGGVDVRRDGETVATIDWRRVSA